MITVLNGMVTMGFLIAALFFLRFWRRTQDGLFVTFAIAFVLLALNQILIGLSVVPREDQAVLYLLRLAAFALLIVAIVRKNFAGNSSGSA
jgi:Family of unknown function (DUF5985)